MVGTNLLEADTDGDGLTDGFEYFSQRVSTRSSPTPTATSPTTARSCCSSTDPTNVDTDGDGLHRRSRPAPDRRDEHVRRDFTDPNGASEPTPDSSRDWSTEPARSLPRVWSTTPAGHVTEPGRRHAAAAGRSLRLEQHRPVGERQQLRERRQRLRVRRVRGCPERRHGDGVRRLGRAGVGAFVALVAYFAAVCACRLRRARTCWPAKIAAHRRAGTPRTAVAIAMTCSGPSVGDHHLYEYGTGKSSLPGHTVIKRMRPSSATSQKSVPGPILAVRAASTRSCTGRSRGTARWVSRPRRTRRCRCGRAVRPYSPSACRRAPRCHVTDVPADHVGDGLESVQAAEHRIHEHDVFGATATEHLDRRAGSRSNDASP